MLVSIVQIQQPTYCNMQSVFNSGGEPPRTNDVKRIAS